MEDHETVLIYKEGLSEAALCSDADGHLAEPHIGSVGDRDEDTGTSISKEMQGDRKLTQDRGEIHRLERAVRGGERRPWMRRGVSEPREMTVSINTPQTTGVSSIIPVTGLQVH